MAINLRRLGEESGNIIEILKKAMIVEYLKKANCTSDEINYDTVFKYYKPESVGGELPFIDIVSGILQNGHGKYINGYPLLRDVFQRITGLSVFAAWKEGMPYIANSLKDNAERAGILDFGVEPDYTDLKMMLNKAAALDSETNKQMLTLQKSFPNAISKVKNDFSHIKIPSYEGVRGCLTVILAIFSTAGIFAFLMCLLVFSRD